MLVRFFFFIGFLFINTHDGFSIPVHGEDDDDDRAAPLMQRQHTFSIQADHTTETAGQENRLKDLFLSFDRGAIHPRLLLASGALTEAERIEAEISCGAKGFIVGLSFLSAVCVSCVEATLTMGEYLSSVIGTLIGKSPFLDFAPELWALGGPTIATTLPKNYIGSFELFMWIASSHSQYGPFSQEGSHLRIATGAVMALALGFKPFFTLMETLEDGREFNASKDYGYPTNPLYQPKIMDTFTVAGLFWMALLVRESFLGAMTILNSLAWGVEKCQKKDPSSQRMKQTMRQSLTFGFRRILKDEEATVQLHREIKALEEEVERQEKELEQQIETPEDEASDSPLSLRERQFENEQTGALITLCAMMKFAQGEDFTQYQRLNDPRCFHAPRAFCDGHPGWYKFFYNFGRTVALAGAFSMYMGWVYAIRESLGTSDETAFVLGAVVSAFFIPYMIDKTGEGLANMVARCAKYNTVYGSDYVRFAVEHLGSGKCTRAGRSTVDILSFFSGALVKMPAAFLGFVSMEEFIFGDIFSMTALGLFVPSLVSFAIVSRSSAEKDLQGLVTMASCVGKDSFSHCQQDLASRYKKMDGWLEKLRPQVTKHLYKLAVPE